MSFHNRNLETAAAALGVSCVWCHLDYICGDKYALGKQSEHVLNTLREPLYSDICINHTDH